MGDLAAHQYHLYGGPDSDDDWTDLAANAPGDGLRAKAAESGRDPRTSLTLGWSSARRAETLRWRRGLEGEERIGGRLERLATHGWRVLHSVAVGRLTCDIDHVLIGPGGVFTVNTKNWSKSVTAHVYSDRVSVRGRDDDCIEKSQHEGRRATELLAGAGAPVAVQPVIVFHNCKLDVHQPADGVLILGSFAVPAAFRRMRPVLTADEVDRIFAVARRSTTWR